MKRKIKKEIEQSENKDWRDAFVEAGIVEKDMICEYGGAIL